MAGVADTDDDSCMNEEEGDDDIPGFINIEKRPIEAEESEDSDEEEVEALSGSDDDESAERYTVDELGDDE